MCGCAASCGGRRPRDSKSAILDALKIPLFSTSLPSSEPHKKPVKPVVNCFNTELGNSTPVYPPPPLDTAREASIIRGCVESMQPLVFQESGCTVCGQLTPLSQLSQSRHVIRFFSILENDSCTRKERISGSDVIAPIGGPVRDSTTDLICLRCRASIHDRKVPKNALANGLWLGEVPEVLSRLSFVERILVSRVRHNCCFVRVALASHPDLGSWKMISHVIAFESPVSKVYDVLPPPRDELDEVLAVMFTRPTLPTEEEMKRTPLLVRHRPVMEALTWLCLNHCDYADVKLSEDNMSTYVDGKAPVAVVYKDREGNKVPEGTSVFDNKKADGTTEGPCPVVVHGLIGEVLESKSLREQKTMATRHFKANRGVLAVGHAAEPQSIYHNTSLYPSMFPWLFPYGLGGIGSSKLSDKAHKKWLLMYHNKRFQVDVGFPFVAFSHKQIKTSTTGGFLLADKDKFFEISERIHRIDESVLENISDRMAQGQTVLPVTDTEKDCFQLLNDLDHVAYNVKGSLTSKKYMRNEAYSLMASEGAPSWYFTMAPSDHSHPICVYWADKRIEFDPIPLSEKDRVRLVMSNPVAAARFFNFMVELFIMHVLRVGDQSLQGLFGDTSAYYGAVEHLSPQQIRDRLLSDNSEFRIQLIRYLESVHKGDYFTSTQEHVSAVWHKESLVSRYHDFTEVLPETPPHHCDQPVGCDDCVKGNTSDSWWSYFRDGTLKQNANSRGCMDNKWKRCKSRFPRKLEEETTVDKETGHINLVKKEAWINTFAPLISYIFRCNTDVTSLRSGLKMHAIFDCIRAVFQHDRDRSMDSDRTCKERACKLMTQMVNVLGAKTEIGSPMICSYLLGFPDHYTNKKFSTFYWKSFVTEAGKQWNKPDDSSDHVQVALKKRNGVIVGVSPVEDYIHRPSELENMTLYDWICTCEQVANLSRSPASAEDPVGFGDIDDIQDDINNRQYPIYPDQGSHNSSDDESSHPSEAGSIWDFVVDDDRGLSGDDDIEAVVSDMMARAAARVPYISHETDDEESVKEVCGPEEVTGPRKGKQRKSKFKRMQFIDLHLLHSSHHVKIVLDDERKIPNFVGGMLPRKDKGDREFYCLTMLVMFRPWRSGTDLKEVATTTWDDAFTR
ncbi:hypothetical protein EV421DRAFT_1915977 [Armillaria borealis]|uniref:Helitron helicase-like domain-containing protein n=1 Tax=Armillaria borealis TaxID=47425 RepID=A0AA39IC22_9AGAR|nr:hypothetical protein EV421DRAFT_1915977 [Armillaria borealis]